MNEVLLKIKQEFESVIEMPSSETYSNVFQLSQEQYEPSREFFITMLEDHRSGWVKLALSGLLDFAGKLDTNALDKIRTILLKYDNPYVKMAAATTLSGVSKWPDPALRQCLIYEQDRDVKVSATRAILTLAKVNFRAVDLEIDRMKAGEIEPEFAEIERITQADADGLYKDLV